MQKVLAFGYINISTSDHHWKHKHDDDEDDGDDDDDNLSLI